VNARSLCALVLLAIACDGGDVPAPKPGGGRVDAVVAKAPKIDIEGFCDTHAPAASARAMVMPELAGVAPAKAGGWRWINVWATWCKPCVQELPMLAGLRERFAADHLPLELVFLSVDADDATVAAFRKAHPGTPEGLRIRDESVLGPWLQSIGLDENSALPIHLFVDAEQRIRCVRMGEVEASHYDTVRGLVQAG
jgi:thiol-disulfide isomerase/thioredoxin